jgi:hypothetical protein
MSIMNPMRGALRRANLKARFMITAIAAAMAGVMLPPATPAKAAYVTVALASSPTCNIKGNISTTGERIYHVPGQKYYDRTIINPRAGERWFCSEAEAQAAGWRRSKL